jgi:site-specific recombinase XerD
MKDPSHVRVNGPLSLYADGFRAELARLGYTPLSAANLVRLMAHLSRWMASEGIEAGGLSPELAVEFLGARRSAGYSCWLSGRGLEPLLRFLRGEGAAPEPAPVSPEGPVEELLAAYRDALVGERGLAATTVRSYLSTAGFFLAECVGPGGSVGGVGARDVREFVLRECGRRNTGAAKNLAGELRSLLRFLFVSGRVPNDLSPAVPAVAGWRGGSLPKALAPEAVARLFASCDPDTGVGSRDLAILTLQTRLGLRRVEVAALRLTDVDWRSGEIMVRGKGGRRERLPLPVDVGEALVAYLRRGRPRSGERAVFLSSRAPYGPVTAGAVTSVALRACARAGVPPAGAHLRHTAATEMLRAGAPLAEVGQVLRHRHPATTAIYAKVDTGALRELAPPWPGGAR